MSKKLAIKTEIQDRLTRLAAKTERLDNDLADEELEQYLDYQEWAIAEIKAGEEDADAFR
jgi:predicted transcriptional regulator